MKKYDMVIARYNENLDWISQIDTTNINIIIYNKGENDINFPFIQLENIGGDSHTYIYHIVNNYNNLAEFTIFIQADPFPHCHDLFHRMAQHHNEFFKYLADCPVFLTESIGGGWEHDIIGQRKEGWDKTITFLKPTALEILGNELPEFCLFAPGQQFIVANYVIQNRKIGFYKNILDMFPKNYLLPWFLERLWLYIFKITVSKINE